MTTIEYKRVKLDMTIIESKEGKAISYNSKAVDQVRSQLCKIA